MSKRNNVRPIGLLFFLAIITLSLSPSAYSEEEEVFRTSEPYRVLGVWQVFCCADQLTWKLDITQQQGANFSGRFSDNNSGGQVKGRINGNRIEFERSGSWGKQLWTAEIAVKGNYIRMVKGSWSGYRQEAHKNDFHAEKAYDGRWDVDDGQTLRVAGLWKLTCCGGEFRWTLNITKQQGNSFTGRFSDNNSGGDVKGRVSGNRIEFERSGSWGKQVWIAEIVVNGTKMRMVKGSWTGFRQEAHRNDFQAERQ